eukprot:484454-Prorocentrum_minimum.AAC.1
MEVHQSISGRKRKQPEDLTGDPGPEVDSREAKRTALEGGVAGEYASPAPAPPARPNLPATKIKLRFGGIKAAPSHS